MTQAGEEQPMTLLQIEDQVRQFYGNIHPNNFWFRSGCVMLAVCMLGTDVKKIAAFLELSPKNKCISKTIQRMREQHFFPDTKTFAADWLKDEAEIDEQTRAVALFCDMMVVAGELTREPDGDTFRYTNKHGRGQSGISTNQTADAGVGSTGCDAGARLDDIVRVAGEHEDGGGDQVCDGPGRVRDTPAHEPPLAAG